MDKKRANYYNYYTDRVWGKINNYDLVINTSMCGLEGAAKTIFDYINNSCDENNE